MIDDEGSFRAPASAEAGRRQAFLTTLAETRNISAAARASGWDRRTAYRMRGASAEFAAAWDKALGRPCKPSRSRQRRQWTAAGKKLFLETLAETANVSAALRRVRLSRTGAYRLRRRDPVFAEAWADAFEAALDDLEAAAIERAKHGGDTVVLENGREVKRTRAPSDALMMFLLKRHRPWRWGGEVVESPAGATTASEVRGRFIARVEAISARLNRKEEEAT